MANSSKYDVVWYWRHGTWMPADPSVSKDLGGCGGNIDMLVARLQRAGYPAVVGRRSVGAPEGQPTPREREAVSWAFPQGEVA